jgi:hypothetical protein
LTGIQELTASEFCAFVRSRHKDYPALTSWLRSHQYLPALKPRKVVSCV